VSYVQAILNAVQGNLNIDVNRIYAVGFSNGGGLTNLLACTESMSKTFAAFATSSPALYNGTLASNGCNTGGHPVALIDFHGLADGQIVRVFFLSYFTRRRTDGPKSHTKESRAEGTMSHTGFPTSTSGASHGHSVLAVAHHHRERLSRRLSPLQTMMASTPRAIAGTYANHLIIMDCLPLTSGGFSAPVRQSSDILCRRWATSG
jgi:poly(3-hydroxybutyrate) depolymerase